MKEFPLKLFTDSGQYTEEALELDSETCQALMPIFKKWLDIGFNPRMIAHVMLHATFGVELGEMLELMFENDKASSEARNDEENKTAG